MPIQDAGDLFGSVGGVQMPARSGARSAGDAILVPFGIAQNGIYLPADYNADGFSEVTVNVPPYYVGIKLTANSFNEALRVSEVAPDDGTQIGETLLDVLGERQEISAKCRGYGWLLVRVNIPNIGPAPVKTAVEVSATGTSPQGADIEGGTYLDASAYISMRLQIQDSSGEIPEVLGASGNLNGMAIDPATYSQLMQTVDHVELMMIARNKTIS